MPDNADHKNEPPGEAEDKYARVRSLLTECVHMLDQISEQGAPKAEPDPTPVLNDFTAREMEFLRLVRHSDCWPYTYIAARMGLKLPTLHYMRRKLFVKLGVNGRTALTLKVRDWTLG